jgi:LAO/AO transport system kinase
MGFKNTGLLERFLAGDERALARAISLVEAGQAEGLELLEFLRQKAGQATIIGITGSPGSGKSTLVNQLIGQARALQKRVAVLAIDPTSPFSGGAILGDRIRMMGHHQDSEVYIRSMATKGHLGGLAASTMQVITLLDAYGFEDIFIETVGVGQSEIEIVKVADITLLVLTPGQGDGVQAFKAGIMEIADVFVVNKADLPGAGRLKREIQAALELSSHQTLPPILETIASTGQGIPELYNRIEQVYAGFKSSGKLETLKRQRLQCELQALLNSTLQTLLSKHQDQLLDAISSGQLSPQQALQRLLSTLKLE